MADRNRIASDTIGWLFMKPLAAYARAKKKEAKAPNMKTSPWAKLIMRRMPYTKL